MWDMWNSTKEKYFMQYMAMLDTGVSTRPSNWQMKLMNAVSYSALGWVLGRQLSFSGQLGLASQHTSQTGKPYNHMNIDTADHIVTSFRFGTFY